MNHVFVCIFEYTIVYLSEREHGQPTQTNKKTTNTYIHICIQSQFIKSHINYTAKLLLTFRRFADSSPIFLINQSASRSHKWIIDWIKKLNVDYYKIFWKIFNICRCGCLWCTSTKSIAFAILFIAWFIDFDGGWTPGKQNFWIWPNITFHTLESKKLKLFGKQLLYFFYIIGLV